MAPKRESVEFELKIEPEDVPFRGNCSAIDEEADRESEQWIADQLDRGNDLAWCWASVTARFRGFEGSDSLGGISCKDRAEFDRVFLPELKANALEALRASIESTARGDKVRAARVTMHTAREALKHLPSDVK